MSHVRNHGVTRFSCQQPVFSLLGNGARRCVVAGFPTVTTFPRWFIVGDEWREQVTPRVSPRWRQSATRYCAIAAAYSSPALTIALLLNSQKFEYARSSGSCRVASQSHAKIVTDFFANIPLSHHFHFNDLPSLALWPVKALGTGWITLVFDFPGSDEGEKTKTLAKSSWIWLQSNHHKEFRLQYRDSETVDPGQYYTILTLNWVLFILSLTPFNLKPDTFRNRMVVLQDQVRPF